MLGGSLDLTVLHMVILQQQSRVNSISLVFSDKPSNAAQAMSITSYKGRVILVTEHIDMIHYLTTCDK